MIRKVITAIVTALGVLLGVLAYGKTKQIQGKAQAKEELHFDDMTNALKIRKEAQDKYNENKDYIARLPIESVHDGLRAKGKLRD